LNAPAARWRRLSLYRLFTDPALLIKVVIGVNIGMFALALVLDPRMARLTPNPLQFLSPSDQSLLVLGATGRIPIDRFHRWWTLISANYLHSGILHIFFNMAAFRQLATRHPRVRYQPHVHDLHPGWGWPALSCPTWRGSTDHRGLPGFAGWWVLHLLRQSRGGSTAGYL
jgi:hypothetical protein